MGTDLVVLSDEMEFLIGFLQEEDDIGQNDNRHQLDFASGVVQISYTFKPVRYNELRGIRSVWHKLQKWHDLHQASVTR